MISEHDRAMAQLHSRVVRGESIGEEALAELHAWYREQDAIEAADVRIPAAAPVDLQALQRDLDQAMLRLANATRYVQELAEQNTSIRQRIAELERRLARQVRNAA